MSDRTLVISDTHFAGGVFAPSPEQLRPLWQGVDRLVVNGDVAEIHHAGQRSNAARQVLELQRVCERDDVELTLISGNHDAYVSDLRYMTLSGDRILITHGDALHPAIAPWSRSARRIESATAHALDRLDHPELDLTERLEIFQHAARAEWERGGPPIGWRIVTDMLTRPRSFWELMRYWQTVPDLARRFARDYAPNATYLLVGHSHRSGIWRSEGLTIINTGHFGLLSRPLAVLVDDASLSVWRVSRRGKRYSRDEQPLVLDALPPSDEQTAEIARNTRLIAGRPTAAAM